MTEEKTLIADDFYVNKYAQHPKAIEFIKQKLDIKDNKEAIKILYELLRNTFNIPNTTVEQKKELKKGLLAVIKPLYDDFDFKDKTNMSKEHLHTILKYYRIKNKIYNAEDLFKKDLPEPDWNVYRLIPDEGITIIAGKAGVLKTFSVLEMSMSIVTGKPFLNHTPTKKGTVFYIDEENGLSRIKKRLLQLKHGRFSEDKFDNLHISSYNSFKIDTDDGKELLKKLINDIKPNVIVLDSLIRLLTGTENESKDASAFYDCVKESIREKNVSMIVIHHMTKSSDGSIEGVRGSGDFVNMASAVITIVRNEGDNNLFHVNVVKVRDMSPDDTPPFDIRVEDEDIEEEGENVYPYKKITLNWAERTVEEGVNVVDRCKLNIEEWIRTNHPDTLKTTDLKQTNSDEGFSDNSLYSAIKKLCDENKLTKIKRGEYTVNLSTFNDVETTFGVP